MKSAQFAVHAAIEERHWWFLARRRIVAALVHRITPPSSRELLVDVGCGTGGNLAAFAQDYACLGIDPSADAIQLASRRFPQARFVCGSDLGALGEAHGQASVFLLMDVLEHVLDDFWLLSTLLAGARPGAHVLITVPTDMRLWTQHDVSFGHFRRYDLARLQRLWEGLPVSVRLLSYYNARLYPIVRVVRTWNRLRGRTGGMAGTDFNQPPQFLNNTLENVFAGECKTLLGLLEGRRRQGFPFGVSAVAILRREEGPLRPREKPRGLAPDPHHPT